MSRLPRAVAVRSQTDLTASRYAVVGCYAEAGPPNFVRHVALLKEPSEIAAGQPVAVLHCGPPIEADPTPAAAPVGERRITVDVVAELPLTAEELERIKSWLAGVAKENRDSRRKAFQQYVVLPHAAVGRDGNGRPGPRRFSCAGLVIEAYRKVKVPLLALGRLPLADEALLTTAYPSLVATEQAPEPVRERVGFEGRADLGIGRPGPWPIALPGYLFHSVEQADRRDWRTVPYVPRGVEDACFPRAAAAAGGSP